MTDGYSSHYSEEIHDLCCVEHGIVYYLLHPHASHIMQPLDLVFYGSLKREWKRVMEDFKTIKGYANFNHCFLTCAMKSKYNFQIYIYCCFFLQQNRRRRERHQVLVQKSFLRRLAESLFPWGMYHRLRDGWDMSLGQGQAGLY